LISESSTRKVGARMFALNVPLFRPGELAVIVAVPGPTPVTAKLTPCVPAGIITVGGTVATDGSLLNKFTNWPPSTAFTVIASVTPLANAAPLKNVAELGKMLRLTFWTCTLLVVGG